MKDETFKDFILDQLHSVKDIEAKRMFGGYGVYSEGKFFGIIYNGRIYFKTDDAAKKRHKEHGMKPFKPSKDATFKNYYEVPVDIIENSDLFTEWADKARVL